MICESWHKNTSYVHKFALLKDLLIFFDVVGEKSIINFH
jgi:hypothetical protein